jgi:uridine phosphorylase
LAPLWQNIKTYDTIIRINIKSGWKCVPLNLKPEHIAHNIIFGRSKSCGKSHNSLTALNFPLKENSKPNLFKGKRISVISTGIGPDIDIVINELDALVNIDLETRKPKKR